MKTVLTLEQLKILQSGDLHGVQSILAGIVDKISLAAAEIIARDQEVIALCQLKDFSIEKLRAAVIRNRPDTNPKPI